MAPGPGSELHLPGEKATKCPGKQFCGSEWDGNQRGCPVGPRQGVAEREDFQTEHRSTSK